MGQQTPDPPAMNRRPGHGFPRLNAAGLLACAVFGVILMASFRAVVRPLRLVVLSAGEPCRPAGFLINGEALWIVAGGPLGCALDHGWR